MRNLVVSAIVAILMLSCSDELSRARPFILTTATTGGTYYPVGVAIATIAHSQLSDSHGISLTAISSAGSLENVKLLRDNQAQFAILQGPFGAWSWNGEGPISSPQTHIRSVSALWQNVEHFVLLSELATSGEIMDLDNLSGQRYVLGARNSGAEQTGRFILETLGIDYEEKFTLGYMGYGPTTSAIQDGNIVGMNIPGGAPVSSITQPFALLGDRLTILNWTQEALDKMPALADRGLAWHFIGPIQSNKTRDIAAHFDWVHSVDRLKVARRLSEQRPADLPPLNVCIQVNVDDEDSKSGIALEAVPALAAEIVTLPNLRLRGLMAIPRAGSEDSSRGAFRQLAMTLSQLRNTMPSLDTLSMGMSADYGVAIEEGATIVRVGTALFGPRTA